MKNKIHIMLISIIILLLFTSCFTTRYAEIGKKAEVSSSKSYFAAFGSEKFGDCYFILYNFETKKSIYIDLKKRDNDIQLIEIPPGDYALKGYKRERLRTTYVYSVPVSLMRIYTFQPGEILFFGEWGVDEERNNFIGLSPLFNSSDGSFQIEYDYKRAITALQKRYNVNFKEMKFRVLNEF